MIVEAARASSRGSGKGPIVGGVDIEQLSTQSLEEAGNGDVNCVLRTCVTVVGSQDMLTR